MAKAKAVSLPAINPKKAYRKSLAASLEPALQGLKEKLGEEVFHHRLKKAVKVLAHGLTDEAVVPKKAKAVKAIKVAKTVKPVKKARAIKRGRPKSK
jgi:hypothetical protein